MKNYLDKFLGSGWYASESQGKNSWVWSKKVCFLSFPSNQDGLLLTVSCELAKIQGKPVGISIYDSDDNLVMNESIDFFLKTIYIPAGLKAIKINVSRVWKPCLLKPGSNDDRDLGICLHSIEEANVYKEECHWLPRTLEIETTSKCNMNPPCIMCVKTGVDAGPDSGAAMPDYLIEKLKPYLNQAHYISLHGGGEPLLTPKTFAFLEIIDSQNTETGFNTNGLLLSKEIAEKIIELKLKRISISFDAATAETYKKIRGQDFIRLKENVKILSQLKKEKGVKYPVIYMNMVLMKENIHEAAKFVDIAYEVGAEKVFFQLLNPLPHYYSIQRGDFYFDYTSQFLDFNDPAVRENIKAARKRCVQLGIKFDAYHKELWNACSE